MTPKKLFVFAKDLPFPIGMAGTNRIVSYLKILHGVGFATKVFLTKPTEKQDSVLNPNVSGNFDGIEFEYLSGRTIWPKSYSKLAKAFLMFNTHVKLIKQVFLQRPNIILTYSDSLSLKIILYCLHRILSFKYIIEETEYPKIFKRTSNRFLIKLYLYFYRKADGMLLINNKLKEYYSKIGAKNLFVLPMSVDTTRFGKSGDIAVNSTYFTYVGGSGGFQRDGVMDMIKAFSIFSERYPEYRLKIVGTLEPESLVVQEIIAYVDNHGLSDKVIFTGFMSADQIPELLENARGILLTPDKDFQSGGFPTKLGEFLASGAPVIITSIEDFNGFFSEKNSFIVEPCNHREIALAMSTIVENPLLAKEIGAEGRVLANTLFNPVVYVNDLQSFLRN